MGQSVFYDRLVARLTPSGLTRVQRMNFFICQMDALGVGFVMGVQPFIAVFLTRLGATNFQIGLLNSIAGFAGLLLSIQMGRILQRRQNPVPWYAGARVLHIATFGLTGLISLLLPQSYAVAAILVLWLVESVPQTMLNVAFTVIMNAIAGPRGRYALLSRRWSVIGLTSAVMALIAGKMLDVLPFPLNYQITFIVFSLIGLAIGTSFSRRYEVELPPVPPPAPRILPWHQRLRESAQLILREKPFVSMMGKRLVFILGTWLVTPLFSLYYVREVQVSDAWIGWITTASKFALLVGYSLWTHQRDRRGSRFVLLATTLGAALYPALVALTRNEVAILVLAAFDGILTAGLNLVFFDELMRTVPAENSALFVGVSMSMQHLMAIIGPLFNTRLADFIGLGWALGLGAAVRFIGFVLFYLGGRAGAPRRAEAQPAG